MAPAEHAALLALLKRHFGDGLIYLQSSADRELLRKAVRLGLVAPDGYLTSAGRRFAHTGELRAAAGHGDAGGRDGGPDLLDLS